MTKQQKSAAERAIAALGKGNRSATGRREFLRQSAIFGGAGLVAAGGGVTPSKAIAADANLPSQYSSPQQGPRRARRSQSLWPSVQIRSRSSATREPGFDANVAFVRQFYPVTTLAWNHHPYRCDIRTAPRRLPRFEF